jgi:hypothetical protein
MFLRLCWKKHEIFLPRNKHDARPQGEAPPEASLQNAPTIDLSQKINDVRGTSVLSYEVKINFG